MKLKDAVVYDIEVFPNAFTIVLEQMYGDWVGAYQISEFRDDRVDIVALFSHLASNHIPMIGFNNLGYDYNIIHALFSDTTLSYYQLYGISKEIIDTPFGAPRKIVWQDQRFAPQIDLFKIHHFDNKAKSTSLKALEINMRSEVVLEAGLPFDQPLTSQQLNDVIIPYNRHDVKETKQFAHHSIKALEFRAGLIGTLAGDVMNFNDTKIGSKILEQRLGDDLCYEIRPRYAGHNQPKKVMRQTPRNRIALSDIIFPYVRFNHPEFQRVHSWMLQQVLTPEDIEDPDATIKTKGVFSGVNANINGFVFQFGTGGIHGSVLSKCFVATEEWPIHDIDVKALYPSIGIVNKLAPQHLGERFVIEYARLPEDRARFQKELGKKSVPANTMKLASNGVYGNSNNPFSVFLDPKFTMTITINGQLMLCMLAEWLMSVPTLQIIQINTDGITYRIHHTYEPRAAEIARHWEKYTLLQLEDADYSNMWIRDVNNYIARDKAGNMKLKGAYWTPEAGPGYADSISEASPASWHKDLGNIVSTRAAVAAMTEGIPIDTYIKLQSDPFDFMCRVKVDRASTLLLGDREMQRVTRYYVARDGAEMRKISPPVKGATVGDYKRKNGISDTEYRRTLEQIVPGTWDERIHTKNKSTSQERNTAIEAGWKLADCNRASDFRFSNVNYDWYVAEANKLMIR